MNITEKLVEDAKNIGIELKLFHVKQFEEFKKLLLEWNEKINLTAITEGSDIISKHFIDSLTCMKYIKSNDKIIDVGTGAGFPGVPIKIVSRETKITLLDSLNKRLVYLNDVIEKLELSGIETIHSRAEELGNNKDYREKYDIAVARAVANLKVLSEYCIPFVRVGGKFICMKGSEYETELSEAKAQIEALGGKVTNVEEIVLPNTDIKHTIIIIEKIKSTPKNFPRRKIKAD